ncbi:MAG: hypothetical protein IPG60_06420 [Bacteroidetes bacterium]|nr:hypothetical protein [Bacteroidota bacterium]
MKNKILAITILFNTFFCVRAFAQITLISTLNPASTGDVCGLAYDADSAFLWSYGCNALEIQSYDTLGNLVISFPLPGGGANDVDLEFAPEPFKINGIEYPKGQLLLINGEVGAAEIYVIDNLTGEALDTLITAFGASHVVGGAYHHIRKTFFLFKIMFHQEIKPTELQKLILTLAIQFNPLAYQKQQTIMKCLMVI